MPLVVIGVERRGVLLQLRSGALPITMQEGDSEEAPMALATNLPACLPARGEGVARRRDGGEDRSGSAAAPVGYRSTVC